MQAQKTYAAPLKLFEAARLPDATKQILDHLYERHDGQGFPGRLAGKDIPFGARILSIVETYTDLTANPKNPYRRTLTAKEAIDVVRQLGGQIFDPNIVDMLRQCVLGDEITQKLASRPKVLLVDPDTEDTAVLELRLTEHGYDVSVARDRFEAERVLRERQWDLVISEIDVAGEDGLAMFEAAHKDERTKDIAFVFLTRRADQAIIARSFELGASDYLVKPAPAPVVVAKAGQVLEAQLRKKGGGLAGSLKEMSLSDVIQVLANGRKTGQLKLVSGGQVGEIHFVDGQIHNSLFGTFRAEEAFYAMLKLTDGNFTLDPSFKSPQRVMSTSIESLLLEAMRRQDEGIG